MCLFKFFLKIISAGTRWRARLPILHQWMFAGRVVIFIPWYSFIFRINLPISFDIHLHKECAQFLRQFVIFGAARTSSFQRCPSSPMIISRHKINIRFLFKFIYRNAYFPSILNVFILQLISYSIDVQVQNIEMEPYYNIFLPWIGLNFCVAFNQLQKLTLSFYKLILIPN